MKRLSILWIFLVLGTVLFTTSCKDDDCTAPVLAENIIGSWSIASGDVEFRADGTLIDPDDAIYGVEINGVSYDQKSYVVDGSTVTITAAASSGASSSADFEVVGNECDAITFSIIGFDVTMSRK